MEAKHIFRGYYLNEAVFTIFGLEYELIPIVEEIERIHAILLNDRMTGRMLAGGNQQTE